MNRLKQLFENKKENILNVYFTAGYPNLEDTSNILQALDNRGVDIIEIGMPYSDPLADGATIQESGAIALKSGMHLDLLFEQIETTRPKLNHASLILMGYYNQVLQYGAERFFRRCKDVGVDGLILPDLPLFEYESLYQKLFEELDLGISFLVTPQTPVQRIKKIDELSKGFIYVVSSASITGTNKKISPEQITYFEKLQNLNLKNPRLIGFGISDYESFSTACKFANGAIIGSAFIRALKSGNELDVSIDSFINSIRNPSFAQP